MQQIKIIYTHHAKKRMLRRSFTELDIENAIKQGKKLKLSDERDKYAFQFRTDGRKYEVVCYVLNNNIYKVKTVYPI